jgi:hypothetical protein
MIKTIASKQIISNSNHFMAQTDSMHHLYLFVISICEFAQLKKNAVDEKQQIQKCCKFRYKFGRFMAQQA